MKKQVVNFGSLPLQLWRLCTPALSPDGRTPWSTGSQAGDEDGGADSNLCPSAGQGFRGMERFSVLFTAKLPFLSFSALLCLFCALVGRSLYPLSCGPNPQPCNLLWPGAPFPYGAILRADQGAFVLACPYPLERKEVGESQLSSLVRGL